MPDVTVSRAGFEAYWINRKRRRARHSAVAPAVMSAPVVTGAVVQGATLSATTGTWSGSPTSYTYQWKRDSVDIGAATSATYVTQVADVGTTVTCAVTATNAIGASSPAVSNGKAVVAFVATIWSASDKTANFTRSGGNLIGTMSADGAAGRSNTSRNSAHGKVYAELTVAAAKAGEDVYFGFGSSSAYLVEDFLNYPPATSLISIYCAASTAINVNGTTIALGSAVQGDVISLAIDLVNKLVWGRSNGGIWNNSAGANPATGVGGLDFAAAGFAASDVYFWCRGFRYGDTPPAMTINPGPSGLAYAIPTGFGAWDDPNLPLA